MNCFCPNLPSRERERENEGPEAVSPSLIIAATIMTAGTELIWRQQLAICALQWLHCGYHYMINTFHYRKPAAVQHLESKKVGFGNSTSRLVSFFFCFFFKVTSFAWIIYKDDRTFWTKIVTALNTLNLFLPSHFILYCKLNIWQFTERKALIFKSNNKPLNYIHQNLFFYMSMHILLQPEISVWVETGFRDWSRLFPWFLPVWLTAGLRPWPNEWRQMSAMCRLPAGQTTFAISNSTQPYTSTCCEINYAFNFYQMRKWVLLSEWFRGRKLGKVRKETQMGKYIYLPGSRSNFAPVIYKMNTLVTAHCWLFSFGKMWIQSHPLFYLPEVTLACLIPACVVCSQENHISCSCYGSKPSFI